MNSIAIQNSAQIFIVGENAGIAQLAPSINNSDGSAVGSLRRRLKVSCWHTNEPTCVENHSIALT